MARVYKITGYFFDYENTCEGPLTSSDFEDLFKGNGDIGRFDYLSPKFNVESVKVWDNDEYYDKCKKEDLDPDDHPFNYGGNYALEEYKKLFKE